MALIDKEAVLHKIGQMPTAWEYGQAVKDIYEIIKNEPAADAAPVVHGRWEFPIFTDGDANDPRCRCSECGSIETPLARHKYCPNCGAQNVSEGGKDG